MRVNDVHGSCPVACQPEDSSAADLKFLHL
jgi:hypothetical protein